MKIHIVVSSLACAVGLCTSALAQQPNAEMEELIAAANKEGTVTLSWSQSTLAGSQGAQRFQAAMNKAYGTNIRINFLPGADMARIVNQVTTEYSAGQKASVDIALGAAPQLVPVLKNNVFEPVAWKSYMPNRIRNEMVEVGGQVIRIVTGLSGATYNSALAPMKPTKLDDFLKPEWKGKIASTPYAAGFDVLLAEDVWGKEKTVNFVRALSKQITGLIRCGEAERIATGEYLALVMDCTG